MRKWLGCLMVMLVLGMALACAAGEKGTPSGDGLTQTLVSQSPWKGTWVGRTSDGRTYRGTFELVFKMEGGAISAVIQNTMGSAILTKFDGPMTDIKIKGERIELKQLAPGTTYELELKLDKEGKLVGLLYSPGLKLPYDVEFNPTKR